MDHEIKAKLRAYTFALESKMRANLVDGCITVPDDGHPQQTNIMEHILTNVFNVRYFKPIKKVYHGQNQHVFKVHLIVPLEEIMKDDEGNTFKVTEQEGKIDFEMLPKDVEGVEDVL